MAKLLDGAIRLIWWSWVVVLRLTHRQGENSLWHLRRWARLVGLGEYPWLWCGCGDSLETWGDVRAGRCWICQMDSEVPDGNA